MTVTPPRSTSSSGSPGNTNTEGAHFLCPPPPPFFVILATMPSQRPYLILLLLLIPFLSRSQQMHRDTLILHFAFNSYRIQPADSARLYQTFSSAGGDSISITGYTDKAGTVTYNQRLSRQRADAAYRWVRANNYSAGTSARHGKVIGGGIAPTPQWSDSDNRRVEIVYYHTLPAAGYAGAASHYDTIAARRRPDARASRPNDSIVVVKSAPANSSNIPDSARPRPYLLFTALILLSIRPFRPTRPAASCRSLLLSSASSRTAGSRSTAMSTLSCRSVGSRTRCSSSPSAGQNLSMTILSMPGSPR